MPGAVPVEHLQGIAALAATGELKLDGPAPIVRRQSSIPVAPFRLRGSLM
jgi:hypothetical protein